MRILHSHSQRVVLALKLGMVIPIIYFAMQIVAAAFYLGYSFLTKMQVRLDRLVHAFPQSSMAALSSRALSNASLRGDFCGRSGSWECRPSSDG